MNSAKLRSAAPIIGLGVLAAAIALTGVGIAASGAADPSQPASLKVAEPAPSSVATQQPSEALPATDAPETTPAPGTPAGAAPTPTVSKGAPAASATPGAVATSARPSAKPSTTAGKKGGDAKPTAKASAKASASGSPATSAGAAGPTPEAAGAGAVPGNYTETSTGTATFAGSSMPISGNSTLVVSPASGQAQTQTVNNGNNSQVEKLVFGTNRVDTTEISISSEVIDADFVLTPQEPLVELTPGATWAWKADSTDGKEHLAFSASYAGTEQVTTGGQTETAAIVKSTLTLTGSIATTITLTDDYDPTYKLDLREHSVIKGSYKGIPYNVDTTSTLSSLKPQ